MNLLILIANCITCDSEKGDEFFLGIHHFFGQHNTISNVSDRYFMTAFTQFWLKTCINIKSFKKPTAHSLGNIALSHTPYSIRHLLSSFQAKIFPLIQCRSQDFFKRGEGQSFFEQHNPGAVVKLSGSSHNKDIEVFLSKRWEVCAVFKPNVKKFNVIAHTKKFCPCTTTPNAFTDTNWLVMVIGEPKNLVVMYVKI